MDVRRTRCIGKALRGCLLLLAACGSQSLAQLHGDFADFEVDWSGPADSPASLSFLLDAPAGKHGFIEARDGHTVYPDGRRFRMWGVNLGISGIFPPKTSAPLIADHLVRVGINCVRFHFADCTNRPERLSLIDTSRDDTRHFNPEALDRMDFFFSELKKRGIYTWLEFTGGRIFKQGDGVRDHDILVWTTPTVFFDPRIQELQKEYVRHLMTHRNPYTEMEYRHDPALVIVELVNETSLVGEWLADRLVGENTMKNSETGMWADIPPSYERDLTRLYNQWLVQELSAEELDKLRELVGVAEGDMVPRLRKAEFAAAPRTRFHREAAFYMDIERRYFLEMQRFLREDIGTKALVSGTSDHAHGHTGYPLLSSTSQLDLTDGHVYWNRGGPLVDASWNSTVVQLSRSAVTGKPFTVSETNHAVKNHEYEGIPILAAYAALQDWDGIFWWALTHEDPVVPQNKRPNLGNMAQDPVKMAQLAAGALLFLRADVRRAELTVGRSYSREQVYESCRLPRSAGPYFTPGFPAVLPLKHAMRISSFDGPPTATFQDVGGDPIESDTGELKWYHRGDEPGLVTVNTPRSEAMIGSCQAGRGDLEHLSARVQPQSCAVVLSALEDKPIAQASRLLLALGGRVTTSDRIKTSESRAKDRWSVQIEVIRGTISLRGVRGAKRVIAQPLDGAGQPLGDPIAAELRFETWQIPIGRPATTTYIIDVQR